MPQQLSRPNGTGLALLFVILYGSGFVGARYGLPYCPPLTFLLLRFAIAATLAGLIALALGTPWPANRREAGHIAVAGTLTVGVFSGGTFVSLAHGVSPAVSALIIALQPALVTLLAHHGLGERSHHRQWLGLACGFAGVAFVLGSRIGPQADNLFGISMSFLALLGLSLGNVYQKRHCSGMNVFSGGALQSASALLVLLPFALLFETPDIRWNGEFLAALLYMAIGVSIGALSLLYVMIRHGHVSKVAGIFYLVPVAAAAASWIILDSPLDWGVAAGATSIGLGLYLINRSPAATTTPTPIGQNA